MMNKIVFFAAICGFTIHLALSQLDGYVPGQDYPILSEIPKGLSFKCDQRLPGYYSDPEAQCQVWHWCLPSGQQYSFLCPNGTIFNQFARVCDWWFNVDCANTPSLYNVNEDLYIVPDSAKRSRRHEVNEDLIQESTNGNANANQQQYVAPQQNTRRGRRHNINEVQVQVTPSVEEEQYVAPQNTRRGRRRNY